MPCVRRSLGQTLIVFVAMNGPLSIRTFGQGPVLDRVVSVIGVDVDSRRRYTFKDVPGATVTISFRIPEVASLLLTDRVARSEDLATRTEALQDALVTWLMVEEWKESQQTDA